MSRKLKMHRVVQILSCLVFCVSAQGLLLAGEIRLTDDPASSINPYVCSLENGAGDLSVVWVDSRDGGVDRIYMTRVTPTGVKLLADLAISDGVAPASMPSCGVDTSGNTHIVWKQASAFMYAKLNTAGGVLVAPLVRVAGPVDYPHVDVEPNGNVHIVWVNTSGTRQVKYRKLNNVGGNLGGCGELLLDSIIGDIDTEYPFVVAPGDGNAYAIFSWSGDDDEGLEHLMVGVAYPNCYTHNGPYGQTGDVSIGRTVMTAQDANENTFLSFESDADSPLQHVSWLANAGIYDPLDQGIGPAYYPSISALSDSQLFMVWEDRRYGEPWILGQAMDGTNGTGTRVGDNCQISNGRSAARRPSVARAGSAAFGVVWDDDRHGAAEIYLVITGPSCAGFEVIDPNPDLVNAGEIVVDPMTLAETVGRKISGLATDGVTPVLLRLPVAGSGVVTFEVSDGVGGTSHVGTLSSPGGFEDATALSRPTDNVNGEFWAFAILKAPDRFVRVAGDEALAKRPILIRATVDPDVGPTIVVERTIDLRRPPTLLLHGLWGRSSSWGWDLMDDPRFVVYTHDYWATNAAHLNTNVREARRGVAGALELMRDQGFAATQVDAFGHSMGGLLLRKHRTSPFYATDANFGAGDLHTLVTVDTPHRGSLLADALMAATSLHPLFERLGKCANCGAVSDMRPSSSEITSLPEALVPAHAFVGRGGSDLIEAGLIASAPREVRAMLLVMKFFGLLPEGIFPVAAQHDFVVGRISQEGGLATGSSQTSVFGFASLVPLNLGLHIYSVTRETQVNDRAVETLNTAADDPATFAAGFPAAGSLRDSLTTPAVRRVPQRVLSGGISISSPIDGSMVTPGVPLEVTVTPNGGFVPTNVLVTSNHDAADVDTAPYTVTLEVPVETTGEVVLQAVAYDALDNLATSDDIHLQVIVAATLTGISTDPSKIYLFAPPDDQFLTVVGHFDDGVDRDLSSGTLGTVYTSSNPAIVTVDANGLLRSHAKGVAFVEVANGAHSTSVIVQVKPMSVFLMLDRQGLTWPTMSGTIGYDVIRGDLPILLGTLGAYELAVAECLVNDWSDTTLGYSVDPLPGESFFFLVRGVTAASALSYDAFDFGATSQVGLRDAGIAMAIDACP